MVRKINRAVSPVPDPLRPNALIGLKRELRQHFELERDIRHSRRAPFDSRRLLQPEVISALRKVFRDRCAFCESRLMGTEADLAHFRPVAGSRGTDGSHSPDHYGWFAYEWRNLLTACADCQRVKANIFPIDGPRAPLQSSWKDATQLEDAQLIDPTVDDPLVHLTVLFDGRLAALTEKGHISLELLQLNRRNLQTERGTQIAEWASKLPIISESPGDSQVEWMVERLTEKVERPGIALLSLYAVCRHLPRISLVPQRTSAAFLRVLPGLLQSVSAQRWQDALQTYRDSDFSAGAGEFYASALKMERPWRDDPGSSARVRAVAIRNFKGIDNLTLSFSGTGESSFQAPCTMLLGENATGKSTVLQAVCLALLSPGARNRLKLDTESFLSRDTSNWRMANAREASVTIEMDGGLGVSMVLDPDEPRFQGPGLSPLLVLAYGARRYFAPAKSKNSGIDATRTLFQPLATIRDPTIWLQRCTSEQFSAVARAIFEVLALERDDHIFRDDDGNVLVRANGRDTPISRMSDGYKSLFAMAVDVMCRMVEHWGNLETARGLVLVDEIETHLHPRWKMQVMTALRRSLPQVQFLVTTHDPLCLRGMHDGEVHVLCKDAAGDIGELQDLPSVRGLRAEQLLTSDYFGLASTSDPEIERLLEKFSAPSADESESVGSGTAIDRFELAHRLSELTIVGDDASQQLISEAMARYLAMRRNAKPIDRKFMREDAVRAILDVLNNQSS